MFRLCAGKCYLGLYLMVNLASSRASHQSVTDKIIKHEALAWLNRSKFGRFTTALNEECDFFPNIKTCLKLFVIMPPTTCSIERSFSTLRRIKTWLRSTISENRLSGLALISIHRKYVDNNKLHIINKVIDLFGLEKRNLKFLFVD